MPSPGKKLSSACVLLVISLGHSSVAKPQDKSPEVAAVKLASTPTSSGSLIAIDEPGFEADGVWKFGQSGVGVNGFFGKPHADYINAGFIDAVPGRGTFFIYNNGPQHDVYQVLKAIVAANTTYRLSILAIDPTFANPFPGGKLRLGYVSDKSVAADDYGRNLLDPVKVVNPTPFNDKKNEPNNETDGIAKWTYTFTTGAKPAGLGKNLRVEVLGGGSAQAIFDNIQLEARAATPTDASLNKISKSDAIIPPPANPVVVMFGDSTTDRGMPTAVNKQLLELMKSTLPKPRLINAGKGGDNATSALDRLERDVLAHNPDIVTVSFG